MSGNLFEHLAEILRVISVADALGDLIEGQVTTAEQFLGMIDANAVQEMGLSLAGLFDKLFTDIIHVHE